MSLFFRYKVVAVPHAVLPLGGRWSRPRPIISVSVIGPTVTRATDGRLDTGADDTIFPERFAALIGVDLTGAPRGQATTADRTPVPVRYAQVALRLTDGVERREWPAWVGFSPRIQRPLFGFSGFLQFFTATFHGDREQVELTVNSLYPGG
jgi:hypothetical protein